MCNHEKSDYDVASRCIFCQSLFENKFFFFFTVKETFLKQRGDFIAALVVNVF